MTNFSEYQQPNSNAASAGRIKMQEIIHRNLSQSMAVVEQVQSQIINDKIVRGASLDFQAFLPEGDKAIPNIAVIAESASILHRNALSQVSEKAEVPFRYINSLLERGDWGADLVAHNLKEIFHRGNGNRYLLRSVGEQTRGFLSDRYRRLDSRPLLDSFVSACQEIGAVPVQGFALETKVRLRAILPVVFEPIPNEVMVFGIEWGNSDFGAGGHSLQMFQMRLACTNGMTLDDVLRQIHLGGRLSDNIEYSQKTYELDTQANVSALRDVVRSSLNPTRVKGYLKAIQTAAEQEISPKQAIQILKKNLNKAEAESAIEAYNSPDVVNLPPGNSMYRLSNAVSWIAQAKDIEPERSLELNKIAGNLIPRNENIEITEV